MEEKIKKFDKLSAQVGGGLVGTIIGLMVTIIILVAAVIPVVITSIGASTATGVTKTILDLLPLFLGIAGLVLIVALIGMRR